jgi:hypothetical protein
MEREPAKRGHLVVHTKVPRSYHDKENVIPTAAVMQPEIDEASCTCARARTHTHTHAHTHAP